MILKKGGDKNWSELKEMKRKQSFGEIGTHGVSVSIPTKNRDSKR